MYNCIVYLYFLFIKITIATPSYVTDPPATTELMSRHRTYYSDSLDSELIDRLKLNFKQAKAYSSKSSSRNQAQQQWQKLQMSISPLNNERVYIVTPQSVSDMDISNDKIIPRFRERPTPGVKQEQK